MRMRLRVAHFFSRPDATPGDVPALTDAVDENITVGEVHYDVSDLPEPDAVAPPEDFRFPWSRPDASIDAALPTDIPAPDVVPILQPGQFDAPERAGFFARLFGRKVKAVGDADAHHDQVELAAGAIDDVGDTAFSIPASPDRYQSFASMSEALPVEADDDASAELAPIAIPALDALDVTLDPAEPVPVPTIDLGEKTDEFEIPDVPPIVPQHADPGATLKVWRDSLIGRLFGRGKVESGKPAEQTMVEGSPTFLSIKFRAFYTEIIRFKHQKSEFTAGFSTAILTEEDATAPVGPEAAADSLSKKLLEILELQSAEARWMGGEAAQRYADAQFAMAALADETFTHTEWDGQLAWSKHLLETKLFKTHGADVELFKRIDRLLKEQPDSGVARDLARVYLLVLAAGFQGKYRPFALQRPLAEYRQRLYEYVHSGDPLLLYADGRHLFPATVERTLVGQAVRRFTSAQRWAAILLIIALGYTVIAHVAWSRVSADLQDVTSRIKSTNGTSTMSTGAR